MNFAGQNNPWQAPLFPIGLAATAGIVLDRYGVLPFSIELFLFVFGLAAWVAGWSARQSWWKLAFLAVSVFALAGIYHRWYSAENQRSDEISQFVTHVPKLVRLRGVLVDEPVHYSAKAQKELRSSEPLPFSAAVVAVTEFRRNQQWLAVSGKVKLTVPDTLLDCHVGDEIEVVGRLSKPTGPRNPGEFDVEKRYHDRRICASLSVRHTARAVTRLRQGWMWSVNGWLAQVRSWAGTVIQEMLPPERQNVARALLLGEQTALEQADWDRFQRTGVVHVLAISGQHLVVLAWFLALILRLSHVSRRRGAIVIAALLIAYALLTGGRAPVMRAVLMVCSFYGGLLLYRVVVPPNSFALAWLMVCVWNPTAIFYAGCQLSFLAVAVLYWGASALQKREPEDPLDRLIRQNRPFWLQLLYSCLAKMGLLYAVTLMVWLAVAPLVAARYHLVCPAGLMIGPPVLLLTSAALISGFLMLLSSAVFFWPGAVAFSWITNVCLGACDSLVNLAHGIPGAWWYVPDIPDWWLWCFYAVLLSGLTLPVLRRRWFWVSLAMLALLCLGLTFGFVPQKSNEFRCTFLAVGHGSCIVLETSDGRTLLYDAGAINGPEVTRRQIAPYLWQRGIGRIDEVILSHADLDHFNGMVDLMQRFSIGQISCTPSFSSRDLPGVRLTIDAIRKRGIPVRILKAGDRLSAGDVQMQVLHPPPKGPAGIENVRSMVILVQHHDHTILLTGDLEGAGMGRMLSLPRIPVDILMSPHHGSNASNTSELAHWSNPKVVISCQGKPRAIKKRPNPYKKLGAVYLTTWKEGAVTVRSNAAGMWVETYFTKQRWKVR